MTGGKRWDREGTACGRDRDAKSSWLTPGRQREVRVQLGALEEIQSREKGDPGLLTSSKTLGFTFFACKAKLTIQHYV